MLTGSHAAGHGTPLNSDVQCKQGEQGCFCLHSFRLSLLKLQNHPTNHLTCVREISLLTAKLKYFGRKVVEWFWRVLRELCVTFEDHCWCCNTEKPACSACVYCYKQRLFLLAEWNADWLNTTQTSVCILLSLLLWPFIETSLKVKLYYPGGLQLGIHCSPRVPLDSVCAAGVWIILMQLSIR